MSEHTLRPFVTGSHAYGTPHEGSDVDLVLFVTAAELDVIAQHAEEDLSYNAPGYQRLGCRSYRYGGMNLLCCLDEKVYQVWWEGTRALKKLKPVTREYACRVMKARRVKAGIEEPGYVDPETWKVPRKAYRGPAEEDIPF